MHCNDLLTSSRSKYCWQNHLLSHPNSCSVVSVVTLTCLFTLHPFLSHTLHFYTRLRSSLEALHCQDPSHIYLIVSSLPSRTPPKHTSVPIPSHTNFVPCQQWQHSPLTSPSPYCFQDGDDTISSVPKLVLLLGALNSHFSAVTLKNLLWHLFFFCWPLNIHLMSENWFPPFKM